MSHGLGFYSPKAIPRKERGDWKEGFGVGVFGKRRSDGGLGRKKMSDARGHAVSDARRRKARPSSSRGCWASGLVRPKRGNDARAGVTGRGEEMGCQAESEEKGNFLFLFPFQLFQSIFK
jgi:hypothetical protein